MNSKEISNFLETAPINSKLELSKKDLEKIIFTDSHSTGAAKEVLKNSKGIMQKYTLEKTHPIIQGQRYIPGQKPSLNEDIIEYNLRYKNCEYFHLKIDAQNTIKYF